MSRESLFFIIFNSLSKRIDVAAYRGVQRFDKMLSYIIMKNIVCHVINRANGVP